MHSIGRYTVLKRLGGGGFGDVFLARDEPIDRDVAIKVFKPRDQNLIAFATSSTEEGLALLRARFLKEARILGELEDCPFVVNVLDFGELEDGSPYYVMPWLPHSLVEQIGRDFFDAQTLAELPEEERPRALETARAIAIMESLLTGLAAAHRKGLIHRDIKPANVMFTDSGQVRLVDFGIAKAPDSQHSTASRVGMGSRNYMAPEQRESARHVDARADVYAIGALAYRILTGRLPQGRYADPNVLCPALSEALNRLILQCLAQDRQDRPRDAVTLLEQWQSAASEGLTDHPASDTSTWVAGGASLSDELDSLLEQQAGAGPATQAPAAVASKKSRRAGALLIILVLAVGLGAAGWWYLQLQDEQLAWHRAQNQNTPEAYLAHINAWPDGHYRDRAQARLTEFQNSRRQAEAQAVDQYQQRIRQVQAYLNGLGYPTPTHGELDQRTEGNIRLYERARGLVETGAADEVLLNQLRADYQDKDAALWARTRNEDGPQAYRAYLARQQQGEYLPQARARLAELDEQAWRKARQIHTPAGYGAYGEAFPEGQYAGRAETLQAEAAWDQARAANTVASYEAYLAEREDGPYRAEALRRLEPLRAQQRLVMAVQQELQRLGYAVDHADGMPGLQTRVAIEGFHWRIGQSWNGEVTQALLEALQKTEMEPGDRFRDCASCPEMVVIPAGQYREGQGEGDRKEKPVHEVTIRRPFALGRYELTWSEYEACIDAGACPQVDDEGWGRGNRPVVNVSWNDITEHYIPWLNHRTGQTYRLPSEAEWQYAARAGAETTYSWGNAIGHNNANCEGCGSPWDDEKTAPVGSFSPNAFGLYDMHGNVSEWLADCFAEGDARSPATEEALLHGDCDRRMYRGGAWDFKPKDLRSLYSSGRGFRYDTRGVRLVRNL